MAAPVAQAAPIVPGNRLSAIALWCKRIGFAPDHVAAAIASSLLADRAASPLLYLALGRLMAVGRGDAGGARLRALAISLHQIDAAL
jgi:hypothetical protein